MSNLICSRHCSCIVQKESLIIISLQYAPAGSTSGALSWLQEASITVQPNQTYTLTDAGRLALNLTKPKAKSKPARQRKSSNPAPLPVTTASGDVMLHQVRKDKCSHNCFHYIFLNLRFYIIEPFAEGH